MAAHAHPRPVDPKPTPKSLRARLAAGAQVFRQVPGTFRILWESSKGGALAIGALTLIGALVPAAIAYVGKLIVDGVVLAASTGSDVARGDVLFWVGVELSLLIAQTLVARGMSLLRQVVGAQLGQRLGVRILEKALTLELRHFEDSAVYDKMQNARREAGMRPLGLVLEAFAIVQNAVTIVAYAALLVSLSPWSVLVLVAASVPSFVSEVKFAGDSFRLSSWRAPEARRLNYLEWILTRDSHVKEVKVYDLGDLVLGRYKTLFAKFFAEDTRLAIRRSLWGLGLGLLSLLAFYACYAWVADRAASATISLGDMTLYLAVFRQGQGAFQAILSSIGSIYEDALFMSNLFAYFDLDTKREAPRADPPLSPPKGPAEIVFEDVSFKYEGADGWALQDVSLTLRPGEKLALVGENGAGKSTIVKLLLRLYEPTSGRITYGGVDLRDMDVLDLRARFGAVFQDFVKYQLSVHENVGVGDVPAIADLDRVKRAADKGGATPMVEGLKDKWETMLGGWFEKGHELSGGQWQKIAVARGFMREDAEVLILDEPSAAIDAESEYELFQRLRDLAADRIALIISHRFSTVRIADRIAVLHGGKVVELGTHEELLQQDGRYAHLFRLQARGYQ
jgi:ATP-binding cassette, subfamily B, bacterial